MDSTFFVVEGALAAVVLLMLTTRWGREGFANLFRQFRYVYIETPLRLITSRRRMAARDYARIAELERELGWRD